MDPTSSHYDDEEEGKRGKPPGNDERRGGAVAIPSGVEVTLAEGELEGEDEERQRQEEERRGVKIWEAFRQRFLQVQSVLDQNRVLISQVNENHQSRLPDNLSKNVALIREVNSNISKIVSLYADLSSNFSRMYQAQLQKNPKASSSCCNNNRHDSHGNVGLLDAREIAVPLSSTPVPSFCGVSWDLACCI
ncbi:unnamed protein product [Victoria cruziana]